MLEMTGISKTYGKSKKRALDSASLSVPDGSIFGFLGPNGAGKTTTIRVLCGALRPDEGEVKIDGVSMRDRPLEAKSLIGLVGDNPEMFNRLKAQEFLNFVADVYRVPAETRKKRVSLYAERFELSEALASPIGSYSRGMKQKLAIIASLVHDPRNWILDEPMVGLDPEAAFHLKEIMRERVQAGKCVFFSTHVMEVAEKVCDRLAIIKAGRIIFTGSLDDLRALRSAESGNERDSLESLFLELVEAGEDRDRA